MCSLCLNFSAKNICEICCVIYTKEHICIEVALHVFQCFFSQYFLRLITQKSGKFDISACCYSCLFRSLSATSICIYSSVILNKYEIGKCS